MNAFIKARSIRFAALFFIVSGILFSCKKEGSAGLGVQPKSDLISSGFIDTTSILSYVQQDDSVKTNSTSVLLLGSYVDPIFGTTTCSFYSQLNIYNNATALDFTGGQGPASELVLDSAVLTLQYTPTSTDLRKLYGTSTDAQTINVYKLTQNLIIDSSYYSARRMSFDSLNPIGSKTFVLQPDSSVTLKGIVYPPHVRIKLDSATFANILSQSPTGVLADNTAFHNFFNGIYVAPVNAGQSSGQGAVFYFDPHGPYTKVVLYYRRHVNAPLAGDTLSYPFEINSSTAYYNRFQHDYTTASDPRSVLTRLSTLTNDTDYIYVQSAAGIRTKLTLPYLKNWVKNGPVAVNKAEVVFKVDGSSVTTNYDAHPKLFLVAADSVTGVGKFNFPDDFYELTSAYGGDYNSATQEYHFNITRHIQQLLDGKKKDYGFYLLPGGSAVNAQRTVMFGSSKVSNKLRFRLTYTKLY
jgi:hypothetical protein